MEKSKNMGIKNTNRYNLAGFYEKVNPYDFEVTKDLINENGFLKIITKGYSVKVYPPLLAYLFEQVEIVAYNIDKKCNEKIKILEYLNTYIEGFKDGEQYFDKEYKVSPEIIYGGNAEHYVKDLHWQYFHAEHEGYEGWVFVKKSYPFILTHEAIRKWGFYSGIVSSLENVVKKHPKLFEAFDKCEHQQQLIDTKKHTTSIEIKPTFKPEAVQIVFDIIKDFFNPEQQPELKRILETGDNAKEKLLFKDNGNRLTDTFKKLFEHDFIISCEKKKLQQWIIENFTYVHRGKVKEFTINTVEKTLSRKDNPCKKPINIEIKNGEICRV